MSTGRLPAAGAAPQPAHLRPVASSPASVPAFTGGVAAQAQAERRRNGWIIPTNKPDRFNLKVMAFNPIPAPDPSTWDLTIEGAGDAGRPR